ncbi:MAG: hypothetical protein JO117_10330, partial [Verrucomicrobia bacterium]|nr:hypothetical protein [Verrucomicrobiota bacterium]
MKTPLRHFSAPACALALILAVPAYALTINPTFDSSITTDPNALVIEAGINAAIARVTADIANNVTVNILFQEGGGLGSSSTYISTQAYSTYVAELGANQTRSVNDNIAITSLPASLAAVNGNAASTVTLALPLLRALG